MTGNERELGGPFMLGPWRVRRTGYGAMQLAGDGVFGPPRDRDEALRVLLPVAAAGVNHIDTAQFYGAGTVNASPPAAVRTGNGLPSRRPRQHRAIPHECRFHAAGLASQNKSRARLGLTSAEMYAAHRLFTDAHGTT